MLLVLLLLPSLLYAPERVVINARLSFPPVYSIYEQACVGSIIPPYLLKAIAIHESGEKDHAISSDGLDLGRMQIREVFRAERENLIGFPYDPHNPVDATLLAVLILEEHLYYTRSIIKALSAYNTGLGGLKSRGIRWEYVDGVLSHLSEHDFFTLLGDSKCNTQSDTLTFLKPL